MKDEILSEEVNRLVSNFPTLGQRIKERLEAPVAVILPSSDWAVVIGCLQWRSDNETDAGLQQTVQAVIAEIIRQAQPGLEEVG